MKQKSRKNVADSNKIEYLKNTEGLVHQNVTQDDLVKALKNVKEDKVQLHKTGGGFWKPKTTNCDEKILAVIQDQVEPLSNPYDSGGVYFKETDIIHPSQLPEDNYYWDCPTLASTSFHTQETNDDNKADQNNFKEATETVSVVSTPVKKIIVKKKKAPMKLKKDNTTEALKRLYFKKKCQNAHLERKKIMLEILHLKQQHNLKMTLLKKELNNNDNN